jgi:hypothetical protein
MEANKNCVFVPVGMRNTPYGAQLVGLLTDFLQNGNIPGFKCNVESMVLSHKEKRILDDLKDSVNNLTLDKLSIERAIRAVVAVNTYSNKALTHICALTLLQQ